MSDPATINYEPLLDMQTAWRKVFRASLKDWHGIAVFIFLLITPVIGIVSGSATVAAIGPVLYMVFLMQRVTKYKNNVWEQFAEVNNWPLDESTPLEELVPPSMQFGHSSAFSPVIQAQLGNLACDLLTYNTTVGAGRYQRTYYFTVARITLPRALPHMLLLSKKAGAELQRDLANKQDLQLEGDFDDYFKLQIEQGQQIDALTVITPDVMQTLVQYNRAEDIEILDSDLYFILNLDKRDVRDMKQLIQSVVVLGDQIAQNITLAHGPQVDERSAQPATILI